MNWCRSDAECGHEKEKPYSFGFEFYPNTPEGAAECTKDFEETKKRLPLLQNDERLR